MKFKRKGSLSVNRNDPKRRAEARRILKFKQEVLGSQEANLIFAFCYAFREKPVTRELENSLVEFLQFARENDYHLIHGETVFCVPFNHLVNFEDLK